MWLNKQWSRRGGGGYGTYNNNSVCGDPGLDNPRAAGFTDPSPANITIVYHLYTRIDIKMT